MNRVMIIGASVLQLPAIKKAKELGYYVAVVDYDPDAIGISYADKYYNVSTIDAEGVVQAALEFKPDGIMTLATDMPMRSIAAASKACNLPGISYETAVKATDKGKMIKAFDEANVEHPWYFIAENREKFDEVLEKITYPCIIKPTDSSGSRGVVLAENRDMLISAYDYTFNQSREGAVIIEEFLQGKEVSVEIMVLENKPHVLQVTDKLTTGAPHFVEMGHNQPSLLPAGDLEKIKDLACRAVKAVGIENGPAHVEIMLTENGPEMIELGARMGGDCITTHLLPLSTGIDMVKATLDIACGNKPDIRSRLHKGSAIRYFNCPEGIIENISGVEEAKKIPGVVEIVFVHNKGEKVGAINSSGDRIGFVIAQADTAAEAVNICNRALNTVKIQVN